VSAASVNFTPEQPSNLTATLIPENGFNQPINLSCAGLPQGTTCTFNPATVTRTAFASNQKPKLREVSSWIRS
jgi:hypothetical protein